MDVNVPISDVPGVSVLDIRAGTWIFALQLSGERIEHRVTLAVDGVHLNAEIRPWLLEGTCYGGHVVFTVRTRDGSQNGKLTGVIERGTMSGLFTTDFTPPGSWEAWPVQDARDPVCHDHVPEQYHRYYSRAFEPALTIVPGDIVRTRCVDSGGRNHEGQQICLGGNPVAGPFYVEGAAPGDAIAVTLRDLRPSRAWAVSGGHLARHLCGDLIPRDESSPQSARWRLDFDSGLAHLDIMDGEPPITTPIRPMLGCIAVAPSDAQTLPTQVCGPFGGNLDYNRLTAGVTLYLPVFHYGAWLFVGDGHAAQGDGEVTGDALEVSMDVEFSVRVMVGEAIDRPYAESDEYLMFFGIARSAERASQFALGSLHAYLTKRLQLPARTAAVLAGARLELDVPTLVGLQHSVVARIRKSALPCDVPPAR